MTKFQKLTDIKKLLFTIPIFAITISCNKDSDKTYCYECDFSPVGYQGSSPGTYQDAGCMTAAQWNGVQFTDNLGNIKLDKNRYCRKKR